MSAALRHPKAAAAALAASAAMLGAAGGGAAHALLDSDAPAAVRQATAQQALPAAATESLADVVARVSPSVVEITVTGTQAGPFGRRSGTSQGSGFVYDGTGHVVTNAHVVGSARTVSVELADGSTHDASVVGTDPSTDLAVLKVDAPASELAALELADSDDLSVGDGVVAIGSPFGLEQTVTTGIVSALHRRITAPNDFAIDDAIQTDAAINHGNSGGPLLDLSGRVVGVNAQIESESGGNDGVGFAIPSNTVARIAAALIADGRVDHAYLGVSLDDGEEAAGARLGEVRTGAPADDAGLRAGDVVTAADGDAVGSPDDLRAAIEARRPGDELELTVERDGETRTVTVVLGDRPTS